MISEVILTEFGRIAAEEIHRCYAKNCCIAATAIAIDVLEAFGVRAEPASVEAFIMNPPAARLMIESRAMPESDAMQAVGGHAIILGTVNPDGPDDPGLWPGHLVAIVDRRFMLDLSIAQASRPQRGINFDRTFIAANIAGGDGLLHSGGRALASLNGCLIAFRRVDREGFRDARDWRDRRKHQPTVRRIIERCKFLRHIGAVVM